MEKDKLIKKEINRLNRLLAGAPPEQLSMADGLIQNAAFMRITLEELQREVVENGAVIQCQSGNGFDTIKDNPAQKAYTTMISRYSAVMTQLMNLVPEGTKEDELLEFIGG